MIVDNNKQEILIFFFFFLPGRIPASGSASFSRTDFNSGSSSSSSSSSSAGTTCNLTHSSSPTTTTTCCACRCDNCCSSSRSSASVNRFTALPVGRPRQILGDAHSFDPFVVAGVPARVVHQIDFADAFSSDLANLKHHRNDRNKQNQAKSSKIGGKERGLYALWLRRWRWNRSCRSRFWACRRFERRRWTPTDSFLP